MYPEGEGWPEWPKKSGDGPPGLEALISLSSKTTVLNNFQVNKIHIQIRVKVT
jgi:hypothetical protein